MQVRIAFELPAFRQFFFRKCVLDGRVFFEILSPSSYHSCYERMAAKARLVGNNGGKPFTSQQVLTFGQRQNAQQYMQQAMWCQVCLNKNPEPKPGPLVGPFRGNGFNN